MSKKLIGILGGPRIGGNADILLDSFIKGAGESGIGTEKIIASRLKISPCDETNYCFSEGECSIKDDMQGVYEKLLNSDYIVISSPIFFAGPPAQLKTLIDRTQAIWARKYILKKKLSEIPRRGFLISVSGFPKKEMSACLIRTIKAFFISLDIKYSGELIFSGVDAKGDINKVPSAIEDAASAGRKFTQA